MPSTIRPDDQRLQRLRKLTEVSRALTHALSLDEVLLLTVERAADLLDVRKAVLMIADDDGVLSVRGSVGVDRGTTESFREPLRETLLPRLRSLFGDTETRLLAVPLVVGGTITGILAAAGGDLLLGEDDEWLLSALADQAAVALEKTRLDEAARLRERLISIVGHDLKNPLGAIALAAEALLRADSLGENQTRLARRIAKSAARMNEMVARLLDFALSRVGGGIPIQREPMQADDVCRQTIEELEIAFPAATFHHEAGSQAEGLWDRERLAQVMSNLVGNAVQYGAPHRPITLRTRDDGPDLVIEVHNEGIPIPAAVLPHVFDPFRRGAEATAGPHQHLGLGLFIARQIVLAHRGSLTVASSDSAGTTFTVRLPRRP